MAKTKLDLILDKVRARESEVTIDVEAFSSKDVAKVVDRAVARGYSASFDGRFILVRDLRQADDLADEPTVPLRAETMRELVYGRT